MEEKGDYKKMLRVQFDPALPRLHHGSFHSNLWLIPDGFTYCFRKVRIEGNRVRMRSERRSDNFFSVVKVKTDLKDEFLQVLFILSFIELSSADS